MKRINMLLRPSALRVLPREYYRTYYETTWVRYSQSALGFQITDKMYEQAQKDVIIQGIRAGFVGKETAETYVVQSVMEQNATS